MEGNCRQIQSPDHLQKGCVAGHPGPPMGGGGGDKPFPAAMEAGLVTGNGAHFNKHFSRAFGFEAAHSFWRGRVRLANSWPAKGSPPPPPFPSEFQNCGSAPAPEAASGNPKNDQNVRSCASPGRGPHRDRLAFETPTANAKPPPVPTCSFPRRDFEAAPRGVAIFKRASGGLCGV